MRRFLPLLAVVALAAPAAAAHQEEDASCTSYKWPLEKEIALIGAPEQTVRTGEALIAGDSIGKSFTMTLSPGEKVAFAAAPERESAGANAPAGVVTLAIPQAGGYQVSLSGKAWIDMVQDGAIVAAADHTGIDGCPVRKSVRYVLAKGSAQLQLSDAASSTVAVVVTPYETGHGEH